MRQEYADGRRCDVVKMKDEKKQAKKERVRTRHNERCADEEGQARLSKRCEQQVGKAKERYSSVRVKRKTNRNETRRNNPEKNKRKKANNQISTSPTVGPAESCAYTYIV